MWQHTWWRDRITSDSAGQLSADYGYQEEPELVKVVSDEDLAAIRRNTDESWQLKSAVPLQSVQGGFLPGGARFLQRAALANAACPGLIPQELACPAIFVFERTPHMNPDDEDQLAAALRALQPQGALEQILRKPSVQLRKLSFAEQCLGSVFVKELSMCLRDRVVSPRELCLRGNHLDDTAADALVDFVGSRCSGAASRCRTDVDLSKNWLTWKGACAILGSIAQASRCLREDENASALDMTFNSIPDPKELLDWASWEYPGTHAPAGDSSLQCCGSKPGTHRLHVNVGPAWCKSEGLRSQRHDKRWQYYMHAPCRELARNFEWAFGETIERQVWTCPLDGKCVNPCAGRRNCPDVTFLSILRNHIGGHKHRKSVGHGLTLDASQEAERGGSPVFEFQFPGRGMQNWTYYFNSLTGAQGWHRHEAEWEPEEDLVNCDVTFVWRDFLRSRSFAASWPTVESLSLESHQTALNYCDDPVVYLVVEFANQPFRALLKPGDKPLFEDKNGFLISFAVWPQLGQNAQPTIFATRASQVYDAFRATDQRRRQRLKLGGEAGLTRAFCEDVEDFLLDIGECQERKQLWDGDAERSRVHEVLGHRVYLHPESHRWTIDAELDSAFWGWLARRAVGARARQQADHAWQETIEELRSNPSIAGSCPAFLLDAAYCFGQLRVLNNRRLYCLKQRPECRVRVRIFPWIAGRRFQTRERQPVVDIFLQRLKDIEPASDGRSVEVRGGLFAAAHAAPAQATQPSSMRSLLPEPSKVVLQ